MISIIITAWKEPKTIGRAIEAIVLGSKESLPKEFEIILACPDMDTLKAGEKTLKKLGVKNYTLSQDPGPSKGKGKPTGLNMAFKKVKGEFLILTDGDVFLEPGSVGHLLTPFKDPNVGGVTGRPVAVNTHETMMGYFGNLLADAAHHKRMVDLTEHTEGYGSKFVKKRNFFPMSGYVMAMRNFHLTLPEDVLADDAFLSYEIFNGGHRIAYAPEAKAYVKYADNLQDYFKQKKRSLGGYIQLWKYNIVKPETTSRSFWQELEYFWFPIKYAKNLKEFFWSLLFYPIRLWLWVIIWFERKFKEKSFEKTWVRIESTK